MSFTVIEGEGLFGVVVSDEGYANGWLTQVEAYSLREKFYILC